MTKRLTRALIGTAAALFALAPLVPAAAIDKGRIGTIGPTKTSFVVKGGPLAGVYPTPDNPEGQPFVGYRPAICSDSTYCDAWNFDIHYPASLLRTEFFGVSITLDWKNARTKSNPTGNDIDLFVWPDNDPALGGPMGGTCGSPRSPKCDNLKSETVDISEPDDTTRTDPPQALYITVVNDSGVNTAYTLTLKWYTFTLPSAPEFHPPKYGFGNQSFKGPFDASVPPPDFGSLEPVGTQASSRKILVPGPDGKMHPIELPAYAAGASLTAADSKPRSPWGIAFVAGGVVLVGMSTYLIIRARRQDAAAL